ncbi:substrate-binding domain-containing protein [Vibrio metschnikovii]|uniref:substrate-binding domain-containing protein n=1 Tax=Vibrio metschnikovii TaxID=28172 RepID=UPI001C306210|nr:substrate-binding domain-containing protein [Vibrio metschnikovii]
MTTIKTLSEHLDLSKATVSRALNGYPEVGAKTRERVLKAAKELGYSANANAKQLATGRSGMIGMILQSANELVDAPTYVEELASISTYLAELNHHLLIGSSVKGDALSTIKKFVSKKIVDGLILKAPEVDDPRIKYLLDNNFPFVVHGRSEDKPNYAFYDIDNGQVTTLAVNHLLDLGHNKIAFINAPAHLAFAQQRQEAFERCVTNIESKIVNVPVVEHAGFEATMALLNPNNYFVPTAIICSSVSLALGCYQAIKQSGLEVGKDISVIAHDDALAHLNSAKFDPPLTVTLSPINDSSRPLAEKMTSLLDGKPIEELQTLLPVELVKRSSTPQR